MTSDFSLLRVRALVAILWSVCAASPLSARERVDFNADIQPILSDRCFLCHGPDASNRQGDLRLDTPEGAYALLEFATGSHAIKPGDPQQSEVYLRISDDDPDLRMPPPGSNLSLSPREIDLIRLWIEQGAEYRAHWAFIPPRRPELPVIESDWVRNEIDRFALRRMHEKGFSPSSEASRETLIRRVTFDLTGVPPTLDELDAFLADESPDAYERLVDRLLASERFGERMASDWLDLARYSDSYGFQVDRDRTVWPWRDWVIRAFNRGLPYDRFLTEQLAGDLLPDVDDETVLATAFNRLHPQEAEGGSVPEEYRMEYVADRTQTVGTAFLGLTLECARCHDHKYDPISQKEYYQLSAFFDNIDEAGLYSFFTDAVPTPALLLADGNQKRQIAAFERQIADEEQELARMRTASRGGFEAWLGSERSGTDLIPGEIAHLDFETVAGRNQKVPGRFGSAVKLTGDDGIGLGVGNFHRFEPFSISLWMNVPDEKERGVVFHRSRAWTDAGSRGYELLIEEGRLSAAPIHFWPGNAIRVRTRAKIPLDTWLHVAMRYDGSSRAAGLNLFINGEPAECDVVRDGLTKNITGGGGEQITIGERFRDRGLTNGLVDEFRVFDRELTPLEIAHLHDRRSLSAAVETPAGKLSTQQREELYDYYLSTRDEEYQRQFASVQDVRRQRSELVEAIPEIMVMRELDHPRRSYLLHRGEYDARGEEVSPGTPAPFGPYPEGAPRNRLGLARWLTGPDHPLTARVAVNRYWQLLFGAGLVRTPEDFGIQGERPTHPGLLDWLARDFSDSQWDLKRLLKRIVTSATYRQSSTATPDLLVKDPENRWLARAPTYRLPAEMLRDNALAVSGLLVETIGGPPVKPYELEVSFKPVERESGPGLYRRSVYTYWNRTGPAPVMTTLDAAKRDVCQVNRERTSSPLQSLVMLNGPQFVEAARMLAQRLAQRHGGNVDALLSDTFRVLTSRSPGQREMEILRELYTSQRADFLAHPEKAERYLSVGDAERDETIEAAHLAAASVVANTLLNYDECVIKR